MSAFENCVNQGWVADGVVSQSRLNKCTVAAQRRNFEKVSLLILPIKMIYR